MTGRRRSAVRSRTASRPATLLAALFAVFLQAFAIQTHVHAWAPLTAAGYEQSDPATSDQHASLTHEQTQCVVCQALAASGNSVLPDAVSLTAAHAATPEAAPLNIRAPPQIITHSWRSRAPPIAL